MNLNNDDNIFMGPSNGELTFGQIFKIIKFSLLRMLVYVLVALLIAGIVCLGLSLGSTQTKNVSTQIEYMHEGIEIGKDPNGKDFSTDDITNINVLDKAIKNANLEIDDTLNAVALASHISVEAIIPPETLLEIQALQSQANKNANINDQLVKFKYFPKRFNVTIRKYDELGLNQNQSITLIDEVIKSYQSFWNSKYVSSPIWPSAILDDIVSNKFSYEYIYYSDTLKKEISSLSNYLKDMGIKVNKVNQVPSVDNITFNSLIRELDALTKEIDLYSAYVVEKHVVKDKTSMLSYLTTLVSHYKSEIDAKTKRSTLLHDTINKIQMDVEKNKAPDGSVIDIVIKYPPRFNELMTEVTALDLDIQNLTIEMNKADSQKKELESNLVELPADDPVIVEAQKKLKSIATTLNTLVDNAQKLVNDFRNNTCTVKTVIPSTQPADTSTVSDKVLLLIVIAAVVIAIIAAISVTVKTQKAFAIKALTNNQKKADEVAVDSEDDTQVNDEEVNEEDKKDEE